MRFSFFFPFLGHYRSVADKFDYFFKEFHEANIPILIECLDLQSHHIVADIGSGTGIIAEKLYEKCGLTKPIWCVDPCAEMQERARERKGIYPVLKTAEEFFSHPEINHCFDRVISIGAAHHFADPVAIYKSIFHSLRPGGIFLEVRRLKMEGTAEMEAEVAAEADPQAFESTLRTMVLPTS